MAVSFFCCNFAAEMKITLMKNRLNIQLLTAAVLTFAGIGLLYLGALLAPQGEIHETILVAFGEIATFAGSILGIDYHYKQKYSNHENPTNKTNSPFQRGAGGVGQDRSSLPNSSNVPDLGKRRLPHTRRNVPPPNDVVATIQEDDAGDL